MKNRKLSAVVMTHPTRLSLADRLLQGEAGEWLDLVVDPDPHGMPSPLRTAMRAWSSVAKGASHHLVLQDDAHLADRFLDRVHETIELLPDAAIALYANWNSRNGAMVRMGALAGARTACAANEYTPLVALVLPAEVAHGFENYARRDSCGWSDDVTMQRYLKVSGVRTFLAVPNLVEHSDVPSIAQNDAHGTRRSACFSTAEVADQGAGTAERLEAVEAIPFFKRGLALCAVRIRSSASEAFETVSCEDYLRRLGISVPAHDFEGTGRLPGWVLRNAWMTAFTMGAVYADAHEQDRHDHGVVPTSGTVLDLALRTIGPGGLCDSFSSELLTETEGELRSLAWQGVVDGSQYWRARLDKRPRAGRRAALRVRAPNHCVLVTGGGQSLLAEYLVRNLADLGLAILSWDATPIGHGHPGITTVPLSTSAKDIRSLLSSTAAVISLNGLTQYYGEGAKARHRPQWDLVRQAMAAGIPKLICCSTHEVYGDLPHSADEEAAVAPLSGSFGAAAWAGEVACRSIGDRWSALTQAVRFATPYGPGVLPSAPPGSFIHQAIRGESIEYAGQADQPIQLVHVTDMARALREVVLSESAVPAFNIGHAIPLTVGEIAKTVTALVAAVPVRFAGAESDTGATSIVCTKRMDSDLNFKLSIPLASGIRSYTQWLAYDDVSWQWRLSEDIRCGQVL